MSGCRLSLVVRSTMIRTTPCLVMRRISWKPKATTRRLRGCTAANVRVRSWLHLTHQSLTSLVKSTPSRWLKVVTSVTNSPCITDLFHARIAASLRLTNCLTCQSASKWACSTFLKNVMCRFVGTRSIFRLTYCSLPPQTQRITPTVAASLRH